MARTWMFSAPYASCASMACAREATIRERTGCREADEFEKVATCAGTRLEAHGRNLQADEKLRTDCAIPSIRNAMLVVTSADMA